MSTKKITSVNKSLLHMLRRAEQYAVDLYADEIGPEGLTPRQFIVLLAIDNNEGMGQTALVAKTGIDRSTLADLVARLIRKGHIQRKRVKEDARANSIRLSATGRRALEATQPAAANVNKRLLSALPAENRKHFISGLENISNALEESLAASNSKAKSERKPKPRRSAK